MMCLSQTAGYAIHALGVVAQGEGRLCLIRDIARASGVPKAYLAKIINQLSRQGLVAAKRGVQGGIFLTRPPEAITLLEVVEAIEGKQFMADCMLSLDNCAAPCICPTHEVWGRMREEITQALQRTSLAHVLGAKQSPSQIPGRKSSRAKLKFSQIPSGRSRKAVLKRYTGNNPGGRHRTS